MLNAVMDFAGGARPMSSISGTGAVLVAGKDVPVPPGGITINDLPDTAAAPFAAVLICFSESVEWDAARLKKMGASRVLAVNARSKTIEADIERAMGAALAGGSHRGPSARLLKAAKVCATTMDPAIFGKAGPMVESLARLSGAPVEFSAGSVLAAVSGLMAGRFSVKVRAGWEVHPVLWLSLVGDASSGKSPAMDLVMKPLRHLEGDAARRYSEQLAQAKTLDKKEVKEAIAALERPRRCLVNNVTIEALQHTAAEQGRGLLGHFDELSEWFASLLRYSRSAQGDRGAWLAAHNGFPVTVDRRSLEEPLRIPHWGVALLGGIPPSVLSALSKNAELENGDGLDVRLLYLRPSLPPLTIRPREGDALAESDLALITHRLWTWRLEAAGARPIAFDEAACAKFEAWRYSLLETARSGGREVSSWVGKLPGLVARLCGVLAALDAAAEGNKPPDTISAGVLRRAATLADLFTAHRRKVELERGAPPVEQLAAELAAFVIEHRIENLNTYEVRRGIVPGIRSEGTLRSVLREFHSAGWIAGYVPFRNDEAIPATIPIDPQVFALAGTK